MSTIRWRDWATDIHLSLRQLPKFRLRSYDGPGVSMVLKVTWILERYSSCSQMVLGILTVTSRFCCKIVSSIFIECVLVNGLFGDYVDLIGVTSELSHHECRHSVCDYYGANIAWISGVAQVQFEMGWRIPRLNLKQVGIGQTKAWKIMGGL